MIGIKDRLPQQHDTVTVEGRTGIFFIIGIDSIQKTVEVRAVLPPAGIVKDVPWTTISYPD